MYVAVQLNAAHMKKNRYVAENGLSREEWASRLEAIGETLPALETV